MNDCIFCKIVNREIPAAIFHETDQFIAFVDILPNNYGHSLIVPKKHSQNIYEVDEVTLAGLGNEIQQVAKAVKVATSAEGINLVMNNEAPAGQVIFHSHIHIIPRFEDDGLRHWPQKKYPNDEAMEEMRKKLEEAISA